MGHKYSIHYYAFKSSVIFTKGNLDQKLSKYVYKYHSLALHNVKIVYLVLLDVRLPKYFMNQSTYVSF